MECNRITHKIGDGSSYDGDMDLIESFVKFANNSTNEMLTAELRAYYVSRALSYWQKLEEYLIQEDIPAYDDNFAYIGHDQKIILDNIDEYKGKFFTMIEDLNHEFDIIKVIKLFAYIGTLSCFQSDTSNFDNKIKRSIEFYGNTVNFNRTFPIVNDNGAFSLNTWLYAFFEGIELVGFTSKESNFDNIIGCSLDIFYHDLDHLIESVLVQKYSEEFYTLKNIYYNILNSNLTKTEKELYVLVLWIIIHEYVESINFNDPVEKSMQTFISWSYADLAAEIIVPEFMKYSHILSTKDNINNAIYYLNNYKFSGKSTPQKTFELDFTNFPENLIDYNYMFLALLYVLTDIKNNYSFYTSDTVC
jgi:hypothetical protein